MNQIRAIDTRLLGKKRTGDEAVFFNLTKELLAMDREHQYLLLTDEHDPKKIALLQSRLDCIGQTNVTFVPLLGRNRFVWNLVTLPWFLLNCHVDVFHTQYILPLFVPRRTKVVNHIHDVSFRAHPELIGWKDRLFLKLLIPRSLKRADRIITPSQFTKDEVARYFQVAPEKIAVIENAVSKEFLQYSDESTLRRIKQRYQLPERFLITVGTLQPRKNIPFLLRAFALIRERLPDMRLVLVGNPSGHHADPDIIATLKELSLEQKVYFPGYIDEQDLPTVIHQASGYVFPSLYEGFGIPLLEAMSQDVPIAASDIPCLREIAGSAALYFDPLSLASCSETLYTLLTHAEQREGLVASGRHQLSLFSWQKSAQKLLALYASV